MRWWTVPLLLAALCSLTYAALTLKVQGPRGGALAVGACDCKTDAAGCGTLTPTTSTTTTT